MNNAAVFRDLQDPSPQELLDLVGLNFNPAVVGCVTAVEGLTRALAVDHGPHGIRTNAVALGSITTDRYEAFLARQTHEEATRIENEMRLLHPLGRVGRPAEVAAAVAYLLSEEAGFVNGVVLPVDGGRHAVGREPEEG